ncbi:DNA polymerase III subunit chi [Rickettsia bellii]|uniref:DNA polymerase III chi subunit HolC n=3 Tax=Rickettsia bellii TaxID=33990 RepID=Q1RGL2_RICBR|nr:DNA polymerase III subunit chi [Rickettsia bellii]ABE05502.1 DNA polymerase III chi subunit HolC [Rickettsia bellii RML369-C]ABV79879.1 DNA polymerase III subunit chi [Rickettsia bellii OSU 85-389]ARD86014.1 DNA polymerase III subunit chi [Rickettsia bellii]KJV90520.1 DNA polymerase III chi subunit, HolC family protein [Rickettsia bellii str. RML An4]KJV92600.1 DNA polymerase III chi subunit, HolC family protein [Rickettsia bellii str. RML Mogi]
MQQFSIYQTSDELLLKAIFLLIEKCYYSDLKSVVLTVDTEQQEMLNKNLWTYSRKQFIPHGSKVDPQPEKQPIYITDTLQNPNNASVLIIISPTNIEKILQAKEYVSDFKRIIIITYLPEDLKKLNLKINQITKQENTIDCFTQDQRGSWNKI